MGLRLPFGIDPNIRPDLADGMGITFGTFTPLVSTVNGAGHP